MAKAARKSETGNSPAFPPGFVPRDFYQPGRSSTRSRKGVQLNKEGLKLTQEEHDKLLTYLRSLLDMGSAVRNVQIQKYEKIDREVYGYLILDEDDEKRERDNQKGFGVKPVDVKLPLTLVRLEEAVTYMLLVLAPDEGIYNAIAPVEQQKAAKAFTRLMNDHAQYFAHYKNFGIFLTDAIKYNFGAILTEWQEIYGNILGNSETQQAQVLRNQLVQTGNEITALDPYNTFYDPAVDPLRCYREGEFVGYSELRRAFWLERAAKRGEYFNMKEAIGQGGIGYAPYFRARPLIDPSLHISEDGSNLGSINYFTLFSMNPDGQSINEVSAHETSYLWVQLYPQRWKLGPAEDLQVWRFTVINGQQIVEGVPMTNAHGNLPVVFGMPNEDGFRWQTKSWAEHLTPFNRFASQQMNVHQRANRKSLYGLLFYDENLFPSLSEDNHDLLAGKIPVKNAAQDMDFRKRVLQLRDAPDTEKTLDTIDALDKLMEKVLPTSMTPQVANLERATQYQAAATVQSANRRNLKLAKILDSQAMTPCRHMQMYNILQYQQSVEILSDSGEILTADPVQFRDAKLQFKISDGLRGLDKLTLILHIKEVLTTVVQSQQAISQIDLVKLLDYWSSLVGDNTDFSQFRIQSPLDALSPEEKNAAFQLLQQAQQQQPGTSNTPATPQAGATTPGGR